jgi:hypothetical protein
LILEISGVRRKGRIIMKGIEVWLFRERQERVHWGREGRYARDGKERMDGRSGKGGRNTRGGKEKKEAWSGKGERNTRGGKERMDNKKWERRKEFNRRKRKGLIIQVGEEEGMQEEKRKGWMTRSGRGERNARRGKETLDDLKWERRKEWKGRKGKDGWP